jgi:hypothetical protein
VFVLNWVSTVIEFDSETVVTFAEATKLLPRRRAGRKPHISTLYRWASRGLKGVVLETIQIGGTTCTSREALQRFFDELSKNQRTDARSTASEETRDRRIRNAEKLLGENGI